MSARGLPREDQPLLSSCHAGRFAAVLYAGVAGAEFLVNALLPDYSWTDRWGLAGAGLTLQAIGLLIWYLPWQSWPRSALLLLIPLSLATMMGLNIVLPLDPYHYEIYALPLFAWIGLVFPRGTALAATPLLAPSYFIPLMVTGHLSRDSSVAFMYLASFCLLQGEGLAWLAARITRAARALETSEAVFHTLVEEAPIGIMITNSEGVFEVVNPALCALIGYAEAELIGQPFATVVPIEQRGALDQRFRERFIRGAREDDETLIPKKDGQSMHVLNIGIPLTALGGEAKRAFFILDITERKRAEQERAAVAEAMAEVSAALGGALELQDLYALILQQVGKILPTDYAQILAPDEDWLTVVAQHGTPPVAVGTRLFHLTQVLDNWLVLQQGRPILIRDTADDPDWRDIPPRVGPHRLRSLISIPLTLDTRLVGVFEVTSTTKDRYNDRHVQIATVFGERITQALRHVRLFEAEQERARAAEELARLRSDFVASVSHELRTPLTAIIGFTEMLQHYWERMPEARRRQQVDHIAQAAGRQQRLVEDLLLLRQAEDGPLTVETKVLPIEPLIQEAVAELQGRYKDQRVSLDGPHDLEVRADPHRVRQILVSLLDNAAKYSPNQGLIEVSWGRQGTEIEVRVRDHGPGVPNDERDRLFTRFGRLAGSKIRSGRVGIGLGLYLGRRLVRAMGGELDLLDSGPMGSTFRIQIPAPPWEDV